MTLIKAIKAKKLKVTKARIAIATVLEQSNSPLKIEALFDALPDPKPDLVTVYRILESFEKAGLVHQVDLRHGHAHYEWGHSHHLVCTNCHTIFPLHGEEIEKTLKSIGKQQKDFTITDHSLEFFGYCKNCTN
jgi:Fur family ferric uptake transcriptional regulator